MFNKLGSKLYQWARDSYQNQIDVPAPSLRDNMIKTSTRTNHPGLPGRCSDDTLDSKGMYFKLIPGMGGIAIEVNEYDDRTGDSKNKLYIVPEDADLSEELSKIITMQSLRSM